MRRMLLSLLLAATATPAAAADLTPHQQWLSFVQGAGYNAAGPTGMYAIQDMKLLAPGSVAYLPPAEKTSAQKWSDQAPAEAAIRVEFKDGQALLSGPGLTTTDLLKAPQRTLNLPNRLTVRASFLDTSLKLWLYNPDLVQEHQFRGLDFFAFDPTGVVSASFTRNEQPVPVNYLDSREHAGVMYVVGTVKLPLAGKTHTLKAYSYEKDSSKIGGVLLLLKDKTSGKSSYGGGRVVEVELPKAAAPNGEPSKDVASKDTPSTALTKDVPSKGTTPATVTVNLNLTYSFLCAHSDFYNCPLSLTDRVDAELAYGEKYPPLKAAQ